MDPFRVPIVAQFQPYFRSGACAVALSLTSSSLVVAQRVLGEVPAAVDCAVVEQRGLRAGQEQTPCAVGPEHSKPYTALPTLQNRARVPFHSCKIRAVLF